jgi:long-subunit fatty acid transport protein
MKNIISLHILLIIFCVDGFAQNDIDAMRYSQITFGGTARFASMAGSMGALGGDISTLSFNPAGIAIFRKTEFSLSPSVFSQTTTSDYMNNVNKDYKLNFNFGNIGLVTSIPIDGKNNKSGWESVNFGISYNRTNNFHNRIYTEGYNKNSSLLDSYVASANGHSDTDFDGFSTGLAWETYLINPDSNGTNIYNHVIKHYGELQRKSVLSKGAMYETALTFGANYKSKLYIGGTIGFVRTRYIEENLYEEIDEKDSIAGFKSFAYSQDLSTTGKGVNFKIGAIYKPADWVRVGFAAHTPSSITMKDEYSSTMKSDLDNGIHYDAKSKQGLFDYTITTPYRLIGSIGFVINKIALINAEYEHIDYSMAQLYSRPNVFGEVNSTIRRKYTNTNNIRVGAEIRLDPIALRAGYALYGSPFKFGDNKNASRSSYTFGIGLRNDNFFLDFAYVYTTYKEVGYLYDPSLIKTPYTNTYTNSSFMTTLGLRF